MDVNNSPEAQFMFVITSLLICAVTLPVLIRGAASFGLVDNPNSRKNHDGQVPLVGGIAILVTLIFLLFLHHPGWWVLSGCLILAVIGVLDDLRDLSYRLKFVGQILAATIVAGLGGHVIHSIGTVAGPDSVQMVGVYSLVFTVMCTIGVINAINMIDGADGLSGGILAISFSALLYIAVHAGETDSAAGISLLLGSLFAFLLFNLGIFGRSFKVFLGDSGSMVLGLLLTTYFIKLSQPGNAPLSPVIAGWIFGLPLIDTISLLVRRILAGQSPFKAGRDHLHHILIDGGMSSRQTVLVMLLLHSLLVLAGVIMNSVQQPHTVFFWVFIALIVIYHFFGRVFCTALCGLLARVTTVRS